MPALTLVLFAGLIALVGLFMGLDRRAYVLELTGKLTVLARVLMGPPLAPDPAEGPPVIEINAPEITATPVRPAPSAP